MLNKYDIYNAMRCEHRNKLIDLNALDKFLNNYIRENGVYDINVIRLSLRREDFSNMIHSAFTWSNTPEGQDFWQKIKHTK